MVEILRLLRLSLLLRIVAGVAGASTALAVSANPGLIVYNMLTLLPTLAVLGATFYAARAGALSDRAMRTLLVAALVALALETVIGAVYFRTELADALGDTRRFPATSPGGVRAPSELRRIVRAPLDVPQFFGLIIAVLGAWLAGRASWHRWALTAILANFLGLAAVEVLGIVDGPGVRMGWPGFLGQSAVILLVCYFVGSLAHLERRQRKEIEAANRQLAEQAGVREQLAASRERVRLARDLHDTMAHSLAGMVLQLDALDALAGDNPTLRGEIERAKSAAKRGLSETRDAINDLRQNAVEDLGLAGALRKHVEALSPTCRATLRFELIGAATAFDSVPTAHAEAIYRIAQEAINNAERHAEAAHITVQLERRPEQAMLRVADDGAGFDTAEYRSDKFGLRGMRERAELIGAHLRVTSDTGTGTQIELSYPMAIAPGDS